MWPGIPRPSRPPCPARALAGRELAPPQTLQWTGLRKAGPGLGRGLQRLSEASGEEPRRQLWVRRAGGAGRGIMAGKALNYRSALACGRQGQGKEGPRRGRRVSLALSSDFPSHPASPRPGGGQGSAAALAHVVLSWDVALVWVGVGKGRDSWRLRKSAFGPRGRPGAQPRAAAERGPDRVLGVGSGLMHHPKGPARPWLAGTLTPSGGFSGLRPGPGFRTPELQVLGGGGGGHSPRSAGRRPGSLLPSQVPQGPGGEAASGISRPLKRMAFGGHRPRLT